ncbi:MAG: ATP-binding protein [Candidatus Bathyarchaeia archaeon]
MEAFKKVKCKRCGVVKEGVYLPSYNLKLCLDCFQLFFENKTQKTIEKFKMFSKNDKIAVAISGGKDSTALAKSLKNLGYNIHLVHINCQIEEENYSKNCQETVEKFAEEENLPLTILDFKKEVEVDVKLAAKIASKEICALCGMVKRYLLNREAAEFDVLVTGHTLDDEAANLLSSLIFWREFLERQWPVLREEGPLKKKAKPFCLTFERETKLYCDILKLPYVKNPCPLRGGTYVFFKKIIQEVEREMPSSIIGFYKGFLKRKEKLGLTPRKENLMPCRNCGYLTVAEVCSFCRLKEKVKDYLASKAVWSNHRLSQALSSLHPPR